MQSTAMSGVSAIVVAVRTALRKGRAEQAIALLDEALIRSPDDAELHFLRGLARSTTGRKREAVADFDIALQQHPDTPPALFNRAMALYALDRVDEALIDFVRVSELEANSVEAFANAGIIHLRREHYAEAVRYLRHAHALAPKRPQLMRSLANALRGDGQLEESLDLHRQVETLAPDDAAALTDHALALLTSGRIEAAQSRYLKALSIAPADQTALAGLYMTANELGQTERVDMLMDYQRLLDCTCRDSQDGFDPEALRSAVRDHPDLVWEPAGRATRLGWQSPMLDLSSDSPFRDFGRMVTKCVRHRLDAIGMDPGLRAHPWVQVRPAQWRLQTWVTILHEGGQQSPHIHPAGWLSGVFYLDAGDALGQDSGALVFGHMQPGLSASALPREHEHQPVDGQIVTFPSYFFHHTQPYRGTRPRISLAFDVIPVTD